MSTLRVTYDGQQHATAVREPHHNVVSIDCHYTGKGEDFSPASLLGISLASCMLLSMGDSAGARARLERAHQIYKEVLGPQHPTTAHALSECGTVLAMQRDFAAARPCLEEALRAATMGGAYVMHAEDILGSIEVGKLADLVLLEGNPLEAISNTRKIAAVVANGRLFNRDGLDSLFAEVRVKAGETEGTGP